MYSAAHPPRPLHQAHAPIGVQQLINAVAQEVRNIRNWVVQELMCVAMPLLVGVQLVMNVALPMEGAM